MDQAASSQNSKDERRRQLILRESLGEPKGSSSSMLKKNMAMVNKLKTSFSLIASSSSSQTSELYKKFYDELTGLKCEKFVSEMTNALWEGLSQFAMSPNTGKLNSTDYFGVMEVR